MFIIRSGVFSRTLKLYLDLERGLDEAMIKVVCRQMFEVKNISFCQCYIAVNEYNLREVMHAGFLCFSSRHWHIFTLVAR